MTLLFDFIPISNNPMSVITAIVLFFAGIGILIYSQWDKKEHARLMAYSNNCVKILSKDLDETNSKVDLLFSKNDELTRDVSYIKSHVAAIHESVGWIKEYIKNNK